VPKEGRVSSHTLAQVLRRELSLLTTGIGKCARRLPPAHIPFA